MLQNHAWGYVLYDSNYLTFWEGQNYGDNNKTSSYQE